MTSSEEWLARGACGYGHALYGPADLRRFDSGKVECERCYQDMVRERVALRLAAAERSAAGRG